MMLNSLNYFFWVRALYPLHRHGCESNLSDDDYFHLLERVQERERSRANPDRTLRRDSKSPVYSCPHRMIDSLLCISATIGTAVILVSLAVLRVSDMEARVTCQV